MNQTIKEIIEEDKAYYFGASTSKRLYRFLTHNPLYQRGRYIIVARKTGYYSENRSSIINAALFLYYSRKKNIIGEKLHIELGPNQFGRRLRIFHNDIIVNAGAIIGDDVELYGNNCIGNKGSESTALGAPIIGNGVSFGVGSSAVGEIRIADNIKISGLSFVNKDLDKEKSLYGGVPATYIKSL